MEKTQTKTRGAGYNDDQIARAVKRNFVSFADFISDLRETSKADPRLMMHIDRLIPASRTMAELIVRATAALVRMMEELKLFKKHNTLMEHIIEINDIEEEGDKIHRESIYALFSPSQDPLMAVKWRSILDLMENVLDNCENVADTVQSIITKNK